MRWNEGRAEKQESRAIKVGAVFPCIHLKEIDTVAYGWDTGDKWEFIEFTGGALWGERRDVVRISQNSVNKGPNQNN